MPKKNSFSVNTTMAVQRIEKKLKKTLTKRQSFIVIKRKIVVHRAYFLILPQ